MSYWKPLIHEGKYIDLNHLEPFEFKCNVSGQPERRVFVKFDEHTFTREITIEDEQNHICFKDRIFCPIRYNLSLGLPNLIKNLPNTSVYETWERGGYVYFAAQVPSEIGPYHIFFTVKRYVFSKKKKGVEMYIQSAYPREKGVYGDGQTPNTISFARLVENTYMERQIRFSK